MDQFAISILLDGVASVLDRRGAHALASAVDVIAAKINPDAYKKEHGRCPRGYSFVDDHCVPSKPAGKKGKKKVKKNYKISPEAKDAKSVADIPDGVKGIKDAFGGALEITKYPPPDVDPATIKVDMSGDPNSHAVMTWRDSKGRQQSAYSNTFKKRNAAKKWQRVKKLDKVYDKAVDKFTKQLTKGKTDRDRDAAAAMLLIAKTGLRPGGEAHLKATGHRGIGTLSPENVTIDGDTITLNFVGKAGKENKATVTDPALAEYLKKRIADPASGERLFATKTQDLQRTMAKSGLSKFKPKDFRTHMAGKVAADVFSQMEDPPPLPKSKTAAKKLIKERLKEAVQKVANTLNNTPSIAKSSYINPALIQGWLKLIGGEQFVTAEKVAKPTADEIFKAALDITLPGAEDEAKPLDPDDPQLEEDPLPL